jgi:hydroxyethylthiazole kinase/thiamine-phosphate diphosphorylase
VNTQLPQLIRNRRPLVYCVTNYVTMDWIARGLLAAGARPIMTLDPGEATLMGGIASGVLLNMGTWSPTLQQTMLAAGKAANAKGVPVVLDPVGAGGLETRTHLAHELLENVKVAAIRGNAGEIAALAGNSGLVRGVDSLAAATDHVVAAARQVARRYHCIVAATGPVDVISDGTRTLVVRSGHSLMGDIPGAGCLGGALVAAALGAAAPDADRLQVVADLHLLAGTAGELAAARSSGPGTFEPAYLDALASLQSLSAGRITPPLSERLGVYVIVNGSTPMDVLEQVLAAGAGTIQFREKQMPLLKQIEVATAMQDLCHRYEALFLINDRVDLAQILSADGVHVGQDDLPVTEARRLLGPNAIIGSSCATPDEARIALAQGADYIGTGPVYATPTKADAGDPVGPAAIAAATGAVALPVVGIGGIAPGNAAPVIQAGACGVSVISSVVNAADPGAATRALLAEVQSAKGV